MIVIDVEEMGDGEVWVTVVENHGVWGGRMELPVRIKVEEDAHTTVNMNVTMENGANSEDSDDDT